MPKKKNSVEINPWLDFLGWAGVCLFLLNYILLSVGILGGQSLIYHSGTLVGSFLVGYVSLAKHAMQPATLNFIFVGIALLAIIKITFL